MKKRFLAAMSVVGLVCASPGAWAGLVLDQSYNVYQTYGNVNVYSLPLNALTYNAASGESKTGPGTPYYVNSSPGAIKDQLVVYSGAGGVDVMTNAYGFDDAYGSPNGQLGFATTSGINTFVPASKPATEIANSLATTWDANLLELKSFLDGGNPVFMFNNNDDNKDQTLAIWAKVWITDASNSVYDSRYLYLSNMGQLYGYLPAPGGDASSYNPGNLADPLLDATSGTTDYVLSGGKICFDSTSLNQEPCDASSITINHNLGANEVAYAGVIPVLNDYLYDSLFNLSDATLDLYTMHIDLRLGCDPRWGGNGKNGECDSKKIDNGYEQLWLMSSSREGYNMSEPGVLALMGFSLLGLAALRCRD